MEDYTAGSDSFRHIPFSDNFEISEKSDLGFVDLMGIHDYSFQFDTFQTCSSSSLAQDFTAKDCSEIGNHFPATPNSSSFSSTSSEALNDEQTVEIKHGDDELRQQPSKTDIQLKAKKTKQKKEKEARFAFMTKSEVDHLEDGYRWRKYGQKAVKNSPYPRSYYRCTSVACNVKKRVERCLKDPSMVVTTYEGQHTHPSAIVDRPSFLAPPLSTTVYGASTTPLLYHSPNALNFNGFTADATSFDQARWARGVLSERATTHLLAVDQYGLLQDAVASDLQWRL